MSDEKKMNEVVKVYDLLGISKERASEIVKGFKHAKIDTDKWAEALKMVKESTKLSGENEFAYFGYVFGKMTTEESDIMSLVKSIVSHHDH